MLLSLESGAGYEDLMLAASVVIGSLLGTNTSEAASRAQIEMSSLMEEDRLHVAQLSALWRDATTKVDLPPWWSLIADDLEEEERQEWMDVARSTVEEAWDHLNRGLSDSTRKRHDHVLSTYTAETFARCLTLIAREKRRETLKTSLEVEMLRRHREGGGGLSGLGGGGDGGSADGGAGGGDEWWEKWRDVLVGVGVSTARAAVEEERFQREFEEELDGGGGREEDDEEEEEESCSARLLRMANAAAAAAAAAAVTVAAKEGEEEEEETKTYALKENIFLKRVTNMLIAEPSKYLIPSLEIVMLPDLEHFEYGHSCLPDLTMEITMSTSGSGGGGGGCLAVDVVAAKSSKKTLDLDQEEDDEEEERGGGGEAVIVVGKTLSRIEHWIMDLEERTTALALRGLSCDCVRCVHERRMAEGKEEETSSKELRLLARIAAAEGRYDIYIYIFFCVSSFIHN